MLNEGGPSAAGAAIEQLLEFRPAAHDAKQAAAKAGRTLPDWLSGIAVGNSETLSDVARLADGLHVVPEFLGDRAPHTDPNTRAVIAGIGMENNVSSLVAL